MDFALTEDQEGYRDCVTKFARKELNAHAAEYDAAGTFPREEWGKAAAEGLTALCIPQAYGGLGYDLVTTAAIMDAFGYACVDSGLVHAVGAHLISATTINLFGTEEQKRKYLPPMCRGEWIGATAATEPEAGSDSGAIRTRAEKCDGGFLINGNKMFISNGPVADVVLVLTTFSSRGLRVYSTRAICSLRSVLTIVFAGETTVRSSMKSPRWESPPSPIGVSSEIGSRATFRTLRTLATGISRPLAISSAVGSRPNSCTRRREMRFTLFRVSNLWTGKRMVRARSAMPRVIAWRIHQVA